MTLGGYAGGAGHDVLRVLAHSRVGPDRLAGGGLMRPYPFS